MCQKGRQLSLPHCPMSVLVQTLYPIFVYHCFAYECSGNYQLFIEMSASVIWTCLTRITLESVELCFSLCLNERACQTFQTSISTQKSSAGLMRHWKPSVCWLTWIKNVLSFQSNFASLCASILAFSAYIKYKHWETHQWTVSFELRCPPIFPMFTGPGTFIPRSWAGRITGGKTQEFWGQGRGWENRQECDSFRSDIFVTKHMRNL